MPLELLVSGTLGKSTLPAEDLEELDEDELEELLDDEELEELLDEEEELEELLDEEDFSPSDEELSAVDSRALL